MIVVIDDAHSADPTMIGFLRQLRQIESGSLLVVLAVWPSRLKAQLDGTTGSIGSLIGESSHLLVDRFRRLTLDNLDRHDIVALIREAAPKTSDTILERFCYVVASPSRWGCGSCSTSAAVISRRALNQPSIQRMRSRRASALVAHRRRWASSRFIVPNQLSATLLSQHTPVAPIDCTTP